MFILIIAVLDLVINKRSRRVGEISEKKFVHVERCFNPMMVSNYFAAYSAF